MSSSVLKAIAEKVDVAKVGEFESLHSQIKAMSSAEVVDFFKQIQSILPRARKTNSYFSYAANSELSGFPVGHPTFNKRAEKLKQACYFAACYADQLVLLDPFFKILKEIDTREIDTEFIFEFSFFLSILIMMDPLIENGIITFSDALGENFCSDCFYKLLDKSDKRILNIQEVKNSTEVLNNEAQVRLVSIDGAKQECLARIEGPADIFDDVPYEVVFPKQGRILTKKDIGKLIPPGKIKTLGILYSFSRYTSQDIATKANIYKNYGINRNFSNSLEISLLKRTFGDKQLYSSNFESDAPILMANSLNDLISLRENEWHHFEKFRNALHACTSDSKVDDLVDGV